MVPYPSPMKALTALFLLAASPLAVHAQPTFEWAGTVPNVSTPGQLGMADDADVAPDGTIYIVGEVNGPRAIVGDFIVDSTFVARYDATGTCMWAKSPGGRRLALDGNNGVYVVGAFSGSMVFAGNTLVASGKDAFVAKYDSNGQELWARRMGGALDDRSMSVAVDGLGRVHVGGYFRGTGTFGSSTLIATHDSTGFLATYDANGNFQWAALAGGFNSWSSNLFISNAMACDAAGNTYMAGQFNGTATFGTTTITTPDFDRLYLVRFDASGNCSWVHAMGAAYGNQIRQIALDATGHVYLFGVFGGPSATFGSATLSNASANHADIFLAQFDTNGIAQWAMPVASSFFNDFCESLDLDASGNAWITGSTAFTSQIGPITIDNGHFLAEFDPSGNVLSAQNFVNAGFMAQTNGLNGDHFLYGWFFNNAEFDYGSGVNIPASLWSGQEGFVAHYDTDLNLDWLRRMGLHSTAIDGTGGLVTDLAGNVYSAGSFVATAILCDDTLRAPLGASHLWLNKRDANGECVWTTQIKCSEPTALNQSNTTSGLARADNGDVILTGAFFGTIDFGTVQLTSNGGKDIFMARFDENGDCLWAIDGGGSGEDAGVAVSVAPNGDILLVGWYSAVATIAGSTLTSQGYADGFVARFDANGNGIWCRSFGGTSWDNGYGVALDNTGNVYITGRYTTSATFDGLTVSGTGDADLFVAKYDPNGELTWLTGSSDAGWKQSVGITVGASGQVHVSGYYYGSMTICSSTLTGDATNYRPFLSCFDSSGAVLWQQDLPCTGTGYCYSMAARPGGDIVLTGSFTGDLTIDSSTLSSVGIGDAWVAAFNSAGDVLWAQAMSGTDPVWDIASGNTVAADANAVHVAGTFGNFLFSAFDQNGGTVTFAPGDPGSMRFAPNSLDVFVVKFASSENISPPFNPTGCDGTVQVNESMDRAAGLTLAPNPVEHRFTITGEAITLGARIIVRDATGREVALPISRHSNAIEGDASSLPEGIYIITLQSARGLFSAPLIKR